MNDHDEPIPGSENPHATTVVSRDSKKVAVWPAPAIDGVIGPLLMRLLSLERLISMH